MHPNPNNYNQPYYSNTNPQVIQVQPTSIMQQGHIVDMATMNPSRSNPGGQPELDRPATIARTASGQDVLMPDIDAMKQAKRMRELGPLSNVQQLVKSTALLVVDGFKVAMSSLLSVFTPQSCPLLESDFSTNPPVCYPIQGAPSNAAFGTGPYEYLWADYNISKHECSFKENFTDLSELNKFVLAWNFITLGVMLGHYIFTWRRERFLVYKLENDPREDKLNLPDIIKKYPHIQERLSWYNKYLFYLSVFGIIIQLINILVSAVLVFRDYYGGPKAVTSFITSVLITAGVMVTAAENTQIGIKHGIAYSCVVMEPVNYNVIDPNEVAKTAEYQRQQQQS